MGEPKSLLIREGSYGCAFTPPLPCKKSKAKNAKNAKNAKKGRIVGKILKKKDAFIELSIAEIIRKIPDYQRYFLIQEKDNCTDENFKDMREKYKGECKIYRSSSKYDLLQLISPYGGESLLHIRITEQFDFIGTLRHMLEAVELMNSKGLCHSDIHEGNILVDAHNTLRIIDFGATFLGDHIDTTSIKRHIHHTFIPSFQIRPPELCIADGLYNDHKLEYKHNTSFYIQETIERKKIFNLIENVLGIRKNQQEEKLVNFFNFYRSEIDDPTYVQMFKKYWRVWDTWAIGTVFLPILQKCFLFPSFVVIWQKQGARLTSVLKGILAADPRERLTAKGALALLNT